MKGLEHFSDILDQSGNSDSSLIFLIDDDDAHDYIIPYMESELPGFVWCEDLKAFVAKGHPVVVGTCESIVSIFRSSKEMLAQVKKLSIKTNPFSYVKRTNILYCIGEKINTKSDVSTIFKKNYTHITMFEEFSDA